MEIFVISRQTKLLIFLNIKQKMAFLEICVQNSYALKEKRIETLKTT